MAKVNIKGVDALAKRLSRDLRIQLNKMFRDKDLTSEIGAIAVADIKKNVNFGSPAKSTKKWRERYDPLNTTDPKYSRGKLNATFTGELLNDLATNVRGVTTESAFEIEHSKKKHEKYQGVNGKIGNKSSYQDISKGLVDKLGYDYFQLTSKAQSKITKLVKEKLFKLLS